MATVEQWGGRLASSLMEDVSTRWVPDVLADADLCTVADAGEAHLVGADALPVEVPGAGRQRTVWQLSGRAMAKLHGATEGLRGFSDRLLHPHVCGYRLGAEPGSAYSDEYRRFRLLTESLAEHSEMVLSTDVSRFFADLDFAAIEPAMVDLVGHAAWAPVSRVLDELNAIGVDELPAGYADARLIANLVLVVLDRSLPFEFTRWVDDYRIFVDSKDEAQSALDAFDVALQTLGLSRSIEKTHLESVGEFRSRKLGRPLDSVYHPQDDSPFETRAAVRNVLVDGMSSNDRRLIRFALPRMREIGDEFAVSLTIDWLKHDPADAPRIVDYLSAFVDDHRIQQQVEELLQLSDPWILARIAPLFAAFTPSDDAWDAINKIVGNGAFPVATRELYVRIATIWGRLRYSVSDLESDWLPTRTAVASLLDLGDVEAARNISRDSGFYEILAACDPLPAPTPRSIL